MAIKIMQAVLSSKGGRLINEDCCGHEHNGFRHHYVLADGAGGHARGDVASRVVVDTVLGHLRQATPDASALKEAILLAGNRIAQQSTLKADEKNMCSTVALLTLNTNTLEAQWAHLGDSRIYWFRRGRLISVTKDHSIAQGMADAGAESQGALKDNLCRNILYAAVGAEGDTPPEVSGLEKIEDGDAFLLCSDGLWDSLDETQITKRLVSSASVEDWLALLESDIKGKMFEGHDNYSAVAVWIGHPEEITLILDS
jgi:serine/threonine protein phosphatase PrpC